MADFFGTDAGEILDGTNDNDLIIGYDGEDQIRGFDGNDTIDSLDKPTNIFAASVNPQRDFVDAGAGDDFVTGGRLDILDGGAGVDTLLLNFNFNGPIAGSAKPITLTLDSAGSGVASDGTSIAGFETVILNLSDTGDNVVDTGNVTAQITSSNGNDVLTTGAGADGVYGGDGNDTLSTGDNADTISGGGGNDVIFGGAGDDSLGVAIATDGSDAVDLGSGNDTVRFDRYDGGSGNIRLTFTSSEVGNAAATDSNSAINQDGGLAVRVQAEDATGALAGDVSRYDDEGTTFIAGTQGITFDVRDLVSGAARGDSFEGVVLGSNEDDSLTFFPPFRSGQNFYYNGGQGNDVISAGSGNDFLVGGAGSDRLNGGAGNDNLLGGAATDLFIFDNSVSTGKDRIQDFGNNDLILTTRAIFDANNDGTIGFGRDNKLDLFFGDDSDVAIQLASGRAVTKVVYEGNLSIDGTDYFAYGLQGLAAKAAFDQLAGDVVLM